MILNTSEKFNVVLNNYSEKIELPFFHCWVGEVLEQGMIRRTYMI